MTTATDFAARTLYERARLAYQDHDGEADAVELMDFDHARRVVLLAEDAACHRRHRKTILNIQNALAMRGRLESGRELLTRLGADPNRGNGAMRCPAHEDRSPSLSWRLGDDGRALLHCFSGCTFAEILEAVA